MTQEIFILIFPQGTYVESGVWKFILVEQGVKEGEYEMWLLGGNEAGIWEIIRICMERR